MLKLSRVNEVVNKVASATIKSGAGIQRADSEPTLDSEGKDALQMKSVFRLAARLTICLRGLPAGVRAGK
jgi:hypothetical protein